MTKKNSRRFTLTNYLQLMLKNPVLRSPHISLGITIILTWIITLVRKGCLVDIQIYDTYFVIGLYQVTAFFSVILVISSILYWLSSTRTLLKPLSFVHIIGTIVVVIYLTSTAGYLPDTQNNMDIPMKIMEYQKVKEKESAFVFGIIVLVILQLLLIVNYIVAHFKRPD